MKYLVFPLLAVVFSISPAAAQTPKPTPSQEDDVVRVTTSLVQVDAIVTDKSGNPVTNLTAKDFELLQDGKQQTITNLSYVSRTKISVTPPTSPDSAKTDQKGTNIILPPPVSVRQSQFGRVLTFVVDDGNCEATQAGMIAARAGLERFVNEQMLPDDSVAIYQTRGGSSLLQQYTSDRARLLAIIRKIRWYPPLGLCNSITGEAYVPAANDETGKPDGGTFESAADKERREAVTDASRSRQVEGVLGVLRFAINGLKNSGGRKILFLMSDSLPTVVGGPANQRVSNSFDEVRDLTNLANRSSVVINSIDVRGMDVPMLSAQDDPGNIKTDVQATSKVLDERSAFDGSRQSGLAFVANETGGKFFRNFNSLEAPIQKVLKSETGYYLIGYQPDDEVFKGKAFHRIELKLNRSDLVTTSRAGFYGITDETMLPKARTGDSELYDALSAPLPNGDLNFSLSAYFANTPAKGNFIHAILYFPGKDLVFEDEPNGLKKVVFDIAAVTLDEKSKVIDDSNQTQTLHIPPSRFEDILKHGLMYSVDVPVKKVGVYTFRTAVRNATAKRIGSSSKTIEIPDLKKGKLLISGLILSGVDSTGKILALNIGKEDKVFSIPVSTSSPAIRQFPRNSIVGYSYTIYNAANADKLTMQVNLYHEGKLMSAGIAQPLRPEPQTDSSRINDLNYLRLNQNVPTGDYVLQVIIRDPAARQMSTQWVDFEVID